MIVVNDSGQPLPEAEWQHSERVKIIHTNRRERIFARNSGAAVARGKYLHFLDDDDWLLPGALHSLWELAQANPDKHWLYGSSQLFDRLGNLVIQLHHGMEGNCFVQVMAGEWIPMGSSLILADAFFNVGGFTPLVLATQDVDLSRKIALHGDFACTSSIVACFGMGSDNSSTDYDRGPVYSRWAREKILYEKGVWVRLRDSARSSYWQGRVVRTYITSVVWNLQHRYFFTAASRAIFAIAAFAFAGQAIFTSGFWQAVARAYRSESFSSENQEAEIAIQA